MKPGIYLKIITFFTVKRFILAFAKLHFTIVSYGVAICYARLLLAIMAFIDAKSQRQSVDAETIELFEQKKKASEKNSF